MGGENVEPPYSSVDGARVTNARDHKLAHLLLETLPEVMGYIGCSLRREAPVAQQAHFHVLRALRDGPRPLAELAQASSVRLPTMSRTVEAMASHGWVERFHEEGDRRAVHVRATDDGLEALGLTEEIGIDRAVGLLDGLSAEERRGLTVGLRRLHDELQLRVREQSE